MKHKASAFATALASLVLAVGCASPSGTEGVDRADAAGDVVIRFRDEAARTDVSIVKVLARMDEIPRAIALDARPALDAFARALDELDGQSASLSAAADGMKAKVATYLELREKDAATMVNPELRQHSINRRREVRDAMEKIDVALEVALPPLLEQSRQMHDVLTYVGNDLTPRGLNVVKDQQAMAHENGNKVRKLLAPVIQQAERLALDISPARR